MMTAIIVTARSGSAITAELATMMVQEEIDALKSMGLNPIQFLVAPKLLAMLIAMPALTVLAMLAASTCVLAIVGVKRDRDAVIGRPGEREKVAAAAVLSGASSVIE